MKNRIIAAAGTAMFLVTTTPSPTFSQDEKSPNECGKYLSEMSQDLDILEALVPNVPPDEASYLDKEYSAAISVMAVTRISAVEHRPLFPAWNLHNQFHLAREALKTNQPLAALTDLKSDLKFAIEMAAHLPHPMANAKIAWDAYDDTDNGRILTLQQVRVGAEKSEYLIAMPGLYISCLASFLPEVK